MTRGLTAANVTEQQADVTRPLLFVELQFDEGTDYLHQGIGKITWGGNDWLGVGDLGEIEAVEEGAELSPFSLAMRLSALDATLLDRAQNSSVYGAPVNIYLGNINEHGTLAATPDLIWSGVMDHVQVTLGEESSIMLACESDLKRFTVPNGMLFTNEHQQSIYPGDQALEYMQQLEEEKIVWRGKDRVTFNRAPPAYPSPYPFPFP